MDIEVDCFDFREEGEEGDFEADLFKGDEVIVFDIEIVQVFDIDGRGKDSQFDTGEGDFLGESAVDRFIDKVF